MSAVLVLAPLAPDGIPFADPDPHPELIRAQRPTVSQLMEAAAVLGAFPASSYLTGEPSAPLTGL